MAEVNTDATGQTWTALNVVSQPPGVNGILQYVFPAGVMFRQSLTPVVVMVPPTPLLPLRCPQALFARVVLLAISASSVSTTVVLTLVRSPTALVPSVAALLSRPVGIHFWVT